MLTIKNLIKNGASELRNSTSAKLDSELLLCSILELSREQLYCRFDEVTTNKQVSNFFKLIKKRAIGTPVAYLVNQKEFRSIDFFVNQSVLVPRPETETLVELALKECERQPSINILELGTGSGIIAASIAKERPDTQITAIDLSLDAIKVAQRNLNDLAIKNVRLCVGSWFSPIALENFFHMIISNPPYVSNTYDESLSNNIRFEPNISLYSHKNGFADLEKIITEAPKFLTKTGKILLEHGETQARQVRSYLKKSGFEQANTFLDLNKSERVTIGWKNN